MTPGPIPGNRWDLLVPRLLVAPRPTVQVVLPYFEQPRELGRALAGLAAQTYPRELLQVVVSDDGSRTPPPLAAAAGLAVTVIRQDDRGNRTSLARQRGAEAGDGEVLVFLDSDMIPVPDLLERIVRWPAACPDALVVGRRRYGDADDLAALEPARVAGWLAGGRQMVRELPEPSWLRDGYASTRDLLDADDRSFRFIISCVLACRRSLFDDVGGFDTATEGYGGEDWELGHRAFTNGAVLIHDPTAVGWHHGPDWGGRGVAQKDQETLRLAALIPEPSVRGAAQPGRRPDVIAHVRNAGWSDRATVSTVQGLLAQGHADLAVRLDDLPERLAALWAGTGRVGSWPPTAEAALSARAMLEVASPAVLRPDAVTRLLAAVAPGLAGRAVGGGGGTGGIALTATRASGRARRWAPPDVDAFVAEVFGTVRLEDLTLPVDPEVDPAALFGGWAPGSRG